MTKEEIIEIARQSGFTRHWEYEKCLVCNPDSLYHFAKLVAEKEREECAKICFEFPDVGYVKAILTCDYHSYLINKRGQE